jgi:hypothetical protein
MSCRSLLPARRNVKEQARYLDAIRVNNENNGICVGLRSKSNQNPT